MRAWKFLLPAFGALSLRASSPGYCTGQGAVRRSTGDRQGSSPLAIDPDHPSDDSVLATI